MHVSVNVMEECKCGDIFFLFTKIWVTNANVLEYFIRRYGCDMSTHNYISILYSYNYVHYFVLCFLKETILTVFCRYTWESCHIE